VNIVCCISCEGYGWFEDEDGAAQDCDWCKGIGYTYRDAQNIDHPIPAADYARAAETLERLEVERLRDLGYTGEAKRPWEQKIRQQRGNQNNSEEQK
jgi:hypothetical protein